MAAKQGSEISEAIFKEDMMQWAGIFKPNESTTGDPAMDKKLFDIITGANKSWIMKYFTGLYQGNIPILSNDEADAYRLKDPGAALHIATLCTAIYGVRFIAIPNDELSDLIIERA